MSDQPDAGYTGRDAHRLAAIYADLDPDVWPALEAAVAAIVDDHYPDDAVLRSTLAEVLPAVRTAGASIGPYKQAHTAINKALNVDRNSSGDAGKPLSDLRSAVNAHFETAVRDAIERGGRIRIPDLRPVTADHEGPEHGHTFRITYDSRGAYTVANPASGPHDAPDFDHMPHQVDVRAHNLRDALIKAAGLPLSTLLAQEAPTPPPPAAESDDDLLAYGLELMGAPGLAQLARNAAANRRRDEQRDDGGDDATPDDNAAAAWDQWSATNGVHRTHPHMRRAFLAGYEARQ